MHLASLLLFVDVSAPTMATVSTRVDGGAEPAHDAMDKELQTLVESEALVEQLLLRVQKLKNAPVRVLGGALAQLNPAGSLSALTVQSIGLDLTAKATNNLAELRAIEEQLRGEKVQAALSLAMAREPLGPQSLRSFKRK